MGIYIPIHIEGEMMSRKWYPTGIPGVRYRLHKTRKHGKNFDRYYAIYYRLNKKSINEGVGWSAEGWTKKKVSVLLADLKKNHLTGEGYQTYKEKRELEKLLRVENEKKILQSEKENITFSNFFNNTYKPILKTNKKPESWRKELEHFKNWLNPEIGHIPIKVITAFNLEKVKKNMLEKGRAPRSIQYVFATFRQVWNYARINEIINIDSPTRKVKLPKVENQRLRFLSYEEADTLLGSLKNKSQQVHNITLLSLHTGVRAKEIFMLTWGVVNFENSSVLIRDSKGKTRHVYLTQATQMMLDQMYQDQAAKEFVFKDRNGKQLNKISNTFFRTVDELGFNDGVTDRRDRVLFHTCRHTFASWHVQNGTDLYTVKELLGHSTIQLTERYSHLRPDGLKKAAQNFDKKVIQNNIIPLEKTENA